MTVIESQGYSMKWHNFLIYFSLWAGAVLMIVSGTQLLTGAAYGTPEDSSRVYAYFSGLKTVDMTFGLLQFAAAGWLIYTRFQLASMKAGAPGKLTAAYVLNVLLSVGYLAAASGVTRVSVSELGDGSVIGTIISGIVMILANRSYYGKRETLFRNGTEAVTAKPAGSGTAEVR